MQACYYLGLKSKQTKFLVPFLAYIYFFYMWFLPPSEHLYLKDVQFTPSPLLYEKHLD